MVKTKLDKSEILTHYFHQFNRLLEKSQVISNKDYKQIKQIFEDYYYIKKTKDVRKWDALLKQFWFNICNDFCEQSLVKISENQKKGVEFSELKNEIEDHQKKINENPSLTEYENCYNTIFNLNSKIDEKISNIKYKKEQFNKGIKKGFFYGILASIIGSLILYFIIRIIT